MKRNLQRIGGRIKLIAFTYSQINKKIKQTINTILLLRKATTSLNFVSTKWERVKEQNRLDLVYFYDNSSILAKTPPCKTNKQTNKNTEMMKKLKYMLKNN